MMEFTIFFYIHKSNENKHRKKILFNNNEIENGSQNKLIVGPE